MVKMAQGAVRNDPDRERSLTPASLSTESNNSTPAQEIDSVQKIRSSANDLISKALELRQQLAFMVKAGAPVEQQESILKELKVLRSEIRELAAANPGLIDQNKLGQVFKKVASAAAAAGVEARQKLEAEAAEKESKKGTVEKFFDKAKNLGVQTAESVFYITAANLVQATLGSEAAGNLIETTRKFLNEHGMHSVLGSDEQFTTDSDFKNVLKVNPLARVVEGVSIVSEVGLEAYRHYSKRMMEFEGTDEEWRQVVKHNAFLDWGERCFKTGEACLGAAAMLATGNAQGAAAQLMVLARTAVTSGVISGGTAALGEVYESSAQHRSFDWSKVGNQTFDGVTGAFMTQGMFAGVGKAFALIRNGGELPAGLSQLNKLPKDQLEKLNRALEAGQRGAALAQTASSFGGELGQRMDQVLSAKTPQEFAAALALLAISVKTNMKAVQPKGAHADPQKHASPAKMPAPTPETKKSETAATHPSTSVPPNPGSTPPVSETKPHSAPQVSPANVVQPPSGTFTHEPVRQPNQSYNVEVNGVKGSVRVGGNGKVEYAESQKLVQEMYVSAMKEQTQKTGGWSTMQEINARKQAENVVAYFDKKTGRVVTTQWQGGTKEERARYSSVISHELAHAAGGSEALALQKQCARLNSMGFEVDLKNGSMIVRKPVGGNVPKPTSRSEIDSFVSKNYTLQELKHERVAAHKPGLNPPRVRRDDREMVGNGVVAAREVTCNDGSKLRLEWKPNARNAHMQIEIRRPAQGGGVGAPIKVEIPLPKFEYHHDTIAASRIMDRLAHDIARMPDAAQASKALRSALAQPEAMGRMLQRYAPKEITGYLRDGPKTIQGVRSREGELMLPDGSTIVVGAINGDRRVKVGLINKQGILESEFDMAIKRNTQLAQGNAAEHLMRELAGSLRDRNDTRTLRERLHALPTFEVNRAIPLTPTPRLESTRSFLGAQPTAPAASATKPTTTVNPRPVVNPSPAPAPPAAALRNSPTQSVPPTTIVRGQHGLLFRALSSNASIYDKNLFKTFNAEEQALIERLRQATQAGLKPDTKSINFKISNESDRRTLDKILSKVEKQEAARSGLLTVAHDDAKVAEWLKRNKPQELITGAPTTYEILTAHPDYRGLHQYEIVAKSAATKQARIEVARAIVQDHMRWLKNPEPGITALDANDNWGRWEIGKGTGTSADTLKIYITTKNPIKDLAPVNTNEVLRELNRRGFSGEVKVNATPWFNQRWDQVVVHAGDAESLRIAREVLANKPYIAALNTGVDQCGMSCNHYRACKIDLQREGRATHTEDIRFREAPERFHLASGPKGEDVILGIYDLAEKRWVGIAPSEKPKLYKVSWVGDDGRTYSQQFYAHGDQTALRCGKSIARREDATITPGIQNQ